MNALLLLSSLAFGDPPEPTYQRLFDASTTTGEAPALQAMPESSPLPAGGWAWPALLSTAGLVGAWQLRKRAGTAAPEELRVVQRQVLADRSTLLVVEVKDVQGQTRRLLLGSANGGLSLLNDLGAYTPAEPAVTPAAVAIPADFDDDFNDDAAPAAPELGARTAEFQSLLDEVLTERQVAPAPVREVPTGRYFSDDDLAPPSAQPAPKRRAALRGRFAGAARAANTDAWQPHVETYREPEPVPPPVVETRVEPVRRGDAALLARPAATTATPPRTGLSLLVKGTLPADALAPTPAALAAPVAVPAPPAVEVAAAEVPPPPVLTIAPVVAPPVVAAPEPTPTRAVYMSPTMQPAAPRAERRLVGPPLRDPRLTAGAPVTPRLRLADGRRPAEEVVPPVSELIARLKQAQDEEVAQPIAVNGQSRSARTEGIKRRFQALTVKEGGR